MPKTTKSRSAKVQTAPETASRDDVLEAILRVAEAIESDPQLTITQKQALLEIYRSFSEDTTQE